MTATTVAPGTAATESARRVAYVAGGTRGIGRAIAARLARDGNRVTVCGSRQESVAACRAWMQEQQLDVAVEQVDVRDRAAFAESIETAGAGEAGLKTVVYAAGRPQSGGADTLALPDWDACLELNLSCAFSCIQASLGPLRRAGGGAIVLISSIWAQTTIRDRTAYITAKTAMTGLVRASALDHASDGIRVNAVAPGFVDTDLLRGSIARAALDVEAEIARLHRCHPLGHMVSLDDVANTVAFLAGEQAVSITGQTICVDGGISIRLSLTDESNLA